MKYIASIAALLLLCGSALPAWGAAYGNPVPHLKAGDIGIGLAANEARETLFFDYAPIDTGTIRLLLGQFEHGSAEGEDIGLGYRHNVLGFDAAGQEVHLGLLAEYRQGEVDAHGHTESFSQLDLVAGFGTEMFEVLAPYVGFVWREVTVEDESEVESGPMLGLDYIPFHSLVIGVEYLIGFEEEDIAAFVEVVF